MKKIVLKIGTSSLVDSEGSIQTELMHTLAEQVRLLTAKGIEVTLVTSGAIAVGFKKLKLGERPKDISKKQACAALGQLELMQTYERVFEKHGLFCAQILVSHDDFGNRRRSRYLADTLAELQHYRVLPVINENDALAVDEIKVGDNDTLSAMLALLIDADALVLITDVDGLYDKPPKEKDAKLIRVVEQIDDSITALAGGSGSNVGTGGMATKLKAAKIATSSGIEMFILNKSRLDTLYTVADEGFYGTKFTASRDVKPLKQSWLIYCANVQGKVFVDDGAKQAVLKRHSLLSCGITKITGSFSAGDVIDVADEAGVSFARGIVAFDSDNAKLLIRDKSNTQLIIHANKIATEAL